MSSILKVDQLKDSGGNAIITSNGSGTFTSSLPNTGITMADQWRLTTGFTGEANPIASNLERNDTAPSLSYLGSQMTESSGIFSFPSTGIYYVSFTVSFKLNSGSRFCSALIMGTTNNSSYSTLSEGSTFITQTGGAETYAISSTDQLLDITDTSNQKIKFRVGLHDVNTETMGNTNYDLTAMRFIRLTDT
jgi:hypothetical protein